MGFYIIYHSKSEYQKSNKDKNKELMEWQSYGRSEVRDINEFKINPDNHKISELEQMVTTIQDQIFDLKTEPKDDGTKNQYYMIDNPSIQRNIQ